MSKVKLVRVTTVPISLNLLLHNQLAYINQFFEVVAVSSKGRELQEVSKREGISVKEVQMEREISLFKDLISLFRLIILFARMRPAIVHANTPKASLLSMIAARLSFVPVRIYSVTGLRFEGVKGWNKTLLILMERLTCWFSSHVLAESKGVKELLQKHTITSKPVYIIGKGHLNGIDDDYWKPEKVSLAEKSLIQKKYGLNNNDYVFLFVGRLVKDKGLHELVQAFTRLYDQYGDARLLLVGEFERLGNELLEDVINLINTHQGIIKAGYQHDVRSFYGVSNVLVLPSYREGFPNVILQAGAMELPVISTDVNGAVEVVNCKNGMIIPKRDSEALYVAMKAFYNGEKEIDKVYCRRVVINSYSQRSLHPQIVEFYKFAITKKNNMLRN